MKKSNKKLAERMRRTRQSTEARSKKKPPIIPPHIEKWKAKIKWFDVALYSEEAFHKYLHYRCLELDALRLEQKSSEKYVS